MSPRGDTLTHGEGRPVAYADLIALICTRLRRPLPGNRRSRRLPGGTDGAARHRKYIYGVSLPGRPGSEGCDTKKTPLGGTLLPRSRPTSTYKKVSGKSPEHERSTPRFPERIAGRHKSLRRGRGARCARSVCSIVSRSLRFRAGRTGFEPATYGVTGRRPNQKVQRCRVLLRPLNESPEKSPDVGLRIVVDVQRFVWVDEYVRKVGCAPLSGPLSTCSCIHPRALSHEAVRPREGRRGLTV